MTDVLLYFSIALNILALIVLIGLLIKINSIGNSDKQFDRLEKTFRDEMSNNRQENAKINSELREEQTKALNAMGERLDGNLERVRNTVDKNLKDIQKDNEERLEKMRVTVDEKLNKTLQDRLSESFKTVSQHLEQVNKGIGEMQSLAEDVGGLKNVLSGVKTRGILGERQLENILEQILSPEQYAKEIGFNSEDRSRVEFAIKMPGKDGESIYLPIDSKFPLDPYYALTDAYDEGDTDKIEAARKKLVTAIKKNAKDISEKYICPPTTTDFAIMFIPVEGLYAEVLRMTELVEAIQRDNKVIIVGPTNFVAFLNSLNMGFKTLAIEKRSSEVWNLLVSIKKEFENFGGVLDSAQKKINDAGSELEKLVGTRSRQIMRQLDNVSRLEEGENKED